ncbi:MAG: hypothetical protein LBK47_09545 [Prevotellaceae bacterium]|nr:hypothetical protein [Prevotellaceae bacterium]
MRFGVNLDAQFFDQTGGKAAFFEVGLGVNVLDRGFILEIYGKVDAANLMSKDKDGNLTLKKSLIAGDGQTRRIVAYLVGRRTKENVAQVVHELENRQPARIYSDKLNLYESLIRANVHGVYPRCTNRIERHPPKALVAQ